MFFIISKILYFLITPIVWVAFLGLGALFLRSPKWKRRCLRGAVIVAWFFSNGFIFNEFFGLWEYEATAMEDIEVHDYGVVLGGFSEYDPTLKRIEFGPNADRLTMALELYHQKKIKKFLVVGGSGRLVDVSHQEAEVTRDFLLGVGVPDRDIVIESKSKNTHENALFAKEILDEVDPGASLLLITSAYHMRRSVGCFEKVGLPVTPFAVDRYSGPRKFHFDTLFIPNSITLTVWNVLLKEMVGYVVYWAVGYV